MNQALITLEAQLLQAANNLRLAQNNHGAFLFRFAQNPSVENADARDYWAAEVARCDRRWVHLDDQARALRDVPAGC